MKPEEFYLHALRAHCVPASSVSALEIQKHEKGCSLMVTHEGCRNALGLYFAEQADAETVKWAFSPETNAQITPDGPAQKLALGG